MKLEKGVLCQIVSGFSCNINKDINNFWHLADKRIIPFSQRTFFAIAADGIAFQSLFSPALSNRS